MAQYFGNAIEREMNLTGAEFHYIKLLQQVIGNFIRTGDPNDNVSYTFYFFFGKNNFV